MKPYWTDRKATIYHGDCLAVLRSLPSESVQCCVTSPPYFGLRDYGTATWEGGDPECNHKPPDDAGKTNKPTAGQRTHAGRFSGPTCYKCGAKRIDLQIGLEETPAEYVAKLVEVFREVRRVLRSDGVAWINLGDSYAGYHGNKNSEIPTSATNGWTNGTNENLRTSTAGIGVFKPKDLLGIPWRVAFALQEPYANPVCVKSEIDRAWLAALFDGEGCIGIRRFQSYRKEKRQVYQDGFVVYTVIGNNDREILDRCVSITGLGKVALKQKADSTDGRGIVSRRDNYGWRLDGNAAMEVIRAIYPYLVIKRKQAILANTLDISNKAGKELRGWQQPLPQDEQEKRERLKYLVNECNQRRPIDIPSWCVEPKQLIEPGWWLRSASPWVKRGAMPESVTDRPSTAVEYIFQFTKSARYFYDADAVRVEQVKGAAGSTFTKGKTGVNGMGRVSDLPREDNPNGRNRRNSDWWFESVGMLLNEEGDPLGFDVTTQPYPGAHFATFPPKLIEPCILAGTSAEGACERCGAPWVRVVEKELRPNPGGGKKRADAPGAVVSATSVFRTGMSKAVSTTGWRPSCDCNAGKVPCVVLDPFGGSCTTLEVARKNGCRGIAIELNEDYCRLGVDRLRQGVLL